MIKKLLVLFIIMILVTMIIPQKQVVYAQTEEDNQSTEDLQDTVGDATILRNGILYTLYKVECNSSQTNQLLAASTDLLSSETNTIYYYTSDTTNDYLVSDKNVSTYYGGTLRATLRQITEWSYVDGVSASLENYSDSFTYFSQGSTATTKERGTSVDTYNNMTYTYQYYVSILEIILECSASTTCTIYGEVY